MSHSKNDELVVKWKVIILWMLYICVFRVRCMCVSCCLSNSKANDGAGCHWMCDWVWRWAIKINVHNCECDMKKGSIAKKMCGHKKVAAAVAVDC